MSEKKTGTSYNDIHFPLSTIIPWVGTIVVVLVAGTFSFTKMSNSNHVAALTTEINTLKSKDNSSSQALSLSSPQPLISGTNTQYLPEATKVAASRDPNLTKFAKRISELENERNKLISELSKKSFDALAPESEISQLIEQLSSPSEKLRKEAVEGLFVLSDPLAFNSLVTYFRKNPDEATSGHNPSISEWYDLLLDLDRKSGVYFVVEQLESEYKFHAEIAYDYLRKYITKKEDIEVVSKQLEAQALRNNNALVRTKSKLLLRKYQNLLDDKDSPKEDNRGMFRVILDIEKSIKELSKSGAPPKVQGTSNTLIPVNK